LTFDGSILTVTGDTVITGKLTAQEFYTELVSASIIFESGSTKFGDSFDDTHQFTGSLQVSGSSNLIGNQIITGSILITGSISTVNHIDFIEATGSSVPSSVEGRIYYDKDEKALTVFSSFNDNGIQVGQESVFHITNNSGITINTGQLVMFSGSIGASGRLTGQLADQTKLPSSVYVMGIATNTMLNNEEGFVTTFGGIRGIDATGTSVGQTWNNGDILYTHPTIAGALSNQEPPAGKWKLIVAAVVHNTVNGTIFVRLTPANNIGELDNVRDLTSTAGDLIVKSGSVWINTKQLTGSYGLTGSLQSTSFTGSLFGSASYAITASHALTSSYLTPFKSGEVLPAGFNLLGGVYVSNVSFTTAYSNTDYSISVIGADARTFTVDNKLVGGFRINTNSGVALDGNVYWMTIPYNNP
jgi:hypothetical protein